MAEQQIEKIYFLDVNVLMYGAGSPHLYKEPCLKILSAVEEEKIKVAVDTECFQEILYRYHYIGLSEKGLELCWDLISYNPTILSIGHNEIFSCLKLYKKYIMTEIRPRDIIHVATMVNNDIGTIITTDRHFDRIDEIEKVDPVSLVEILRL